MSGVSRSDELKQWIASGGPTPTIFTGLDLMRRATPVAAASEKPLDLAGPRKADPWPGKHGY